MSRTHYGQGDYRVVAERLLPAAEERVAWCDPERGSLVLDVVAGTGNVALTCVRRGCRSVALDLEVEQLKVLRGLDPSVPVVCGDALQLPLEDGSVDHVLSTFGIVYAPDPGAAVREAGRVCRPSGFVGVTAWPADGLQTRARSLLAEMDPKVGASPGVVDAAWTADDRIVATLAPLGPVDVRRGRLEARFAGVDAWWDVSAVSAPPLVAARSRLSDAEFEELGARLRALVGEWSRADGDGIVLVEEDLIARVRRTSC